MPSYSNMVKTIDAASAALARLGKAARATSGELEGAGGSIRQSTQRVEAHHGSLVALGNQAREVGATVSAHLEAAVEKGEKTSSQLSGALERLQKESATRLDDLIFELERMAKAGNASATSLLDVVRQVSQGTADASAAVESFGQGVFLFEGQLQSVKDVLNDLLPTTGEVQERIHELSKELKGAEIGEIVDRLKGQWNQYAQLLAETVRAYQEGRVTLERVISLARQIQETLPGSETGALAEAIKDGLLGGLL